MKLKCVDGPWDGKWVNVPNPKCRIEVPCGGVATFYEALKISFDDDARAVTILVPEGTTSGLAVEFLVEEYGEAG